MGKRSEFEKIPKDQYMTIDPRAVKTLEPFLEIEYNNLEETKTFNSNILRFAEPCAGNGDLVRAIENTGKAVCLWASDKYIPFSDGYEDFVLDAMELNSGYLTDVDLIITNPPWSRPILHPMIEHFANLKPTWLLFDADWMHTKQSSELIKKYCTDIVSVGRLIWIPDTKTSGKDNCAWYRFDKNKTKYDYVGFHGR